MIRVSKTVVVEEHELEERFIHAAGPGGQNVNKVASAVQLRFHAAASPALSEEVKSRLFRLAGKRATADGDIVIEAKRYRSQERNRADARERLATLIRRALEPPKPRKRTRPGKAAKEKRLAEKHHRAEIKKKRGPVQWEGK